MGAGRLTQPYHYSASNGGMPFRWGRVGGWTTVAQAWTTGTCVVANVNGHASCGHSD